MMTFAKFALMKAAQPSPDDAQQPGDSLPSFISEALAGSVVYMPEKVANTVALSGLDDINVQVLAMAGQIGAISEQLDTLQQQVLAKPTLPEKAKTIGALLQQLADHGLTIKNISQTTQMMAHQMPEFELVLTVMPEPGSASVMSGVFEFIMDNTPGFMNAKSG